MLSKLSLIVIFAILFTLSFSYSVAEDIDLIIFGGQSNAQGWQGDAKLYPEDNIDIEIKFYWKTPTFGSSDGKWKNLQPQPGRFDQGHFGPDLSFIRQLKKSGLNVALFKYTLGGAGIVNDWKLPGQGGLYDDMVKEYNHAISLLEATGDTVNVVGFFWIQGESDAETDQMANAFYDNLKILITDIRGNVVMNDHLPVILGVDEQHIWVVERPVIVEAQKQLALEDDHISFTSMLGIEKADGTHLTPAGLAIHGQRLYDAYSTYINK
jgi:hypothetical protein